MRGPSSVGEISDALDLSQSLVSHNLRLLRSARLVKGERQSKQVFYEIDDLHVSQVLLDMVRRMARRPRRRTVKMQPAPQVAAPRPSPSCIPAAANPSISNAIARP